MDCFICGRGRHPLHARCEPVLSAVGRKTRESGIRPKAVSWFNSLCQVRSRDLRSQLRIRRACDSRLIQPEFKAWNTICYYSELPMNRRLRRIYERWIKTGERKVGIRGIRNARLQIRSNSLEQRPFAVRQIQVAEKHRWLNFYLLSR